MCQDTETVLVEEDSADTRRVPMQTPRGYGYRVVTAKDGEAAAHAARPARPRLIVMDPHMPVLDGPGAPAGCPVSTGSRPSPPPPSTPS